jgi:hypothetical protein
MEARFGTIGDRLALKRELAENEQGTMTPQP